MQTRIFTYDEVLKYKADAFAAGAHAAVGQKRKYTGEPYIIHPREVAEIVEAIPGCTIGMIQAAILHDVVEDTGVTLEDIETEFGPEVARIVNGLTDASKPEDGNRKTRKAIDKQHLAEQCGQVHDIKLADSFHNIQNIVQHDQNFAKVYLVEKRDVLEVLTKGDPVMLERVKQLIEYSAQQLGFDFRK